MQIYTEDFGRVAYLTPKSKGKKNATFRTLFYPLSVLDLEVEHKNLQNIHRIKEARVLCPPQSLLYDPVKTTIGIFLAEFIGKLTRDVQPNKLLFDFIFHSIQVLDLTESGFANFHLVFMIRMSLFLGFFPDSASYDKGAYFDLQGGVFVRNKPFHPYFLNPDEASAFHLLLRMNYENMHTFRFSREERGGIIKRVLDYYRLHLADFPDLKSLEVLHDVFD